MNLQSAIILGVAAIVAQSSHADTWESSWNSDDKRPSYCVAEALGRVAVKPSTVSSSCYSTSNGSYLYNQLAAEKTCVEFKLANKDSDCAVSTAAHSTDSKECLFHKVDYFRRPSIAEQVEHACRSVADCLGKAFAKDDVRGIDWSNSMSAKLGCK